MEHVSRTLGMTHGFGGSSGVAENFLFLLVALRLGWEAGFSEPNEVVTPHWAWVPGPRVTFFACTKKVTKEMHPLRARPAGPLCSSGISGVFRQGIPALTEDDRHPCRSPAGLIQNSLRCSARTKGEFPGRCPGPRE